MCVLNSTVCARINLNILHTNVVAVFIDFLLVACLLFVFVVLLYVNLTVKLSYLYSGAIY